MTLAEEREASVRRRQQREAPALQRAVAKRGARHALHGSSADQKRRGAMGGWWKKRQNEAKR